MVRREGGTDARSNEDTCSRLYTASIEGKKKKFAKSPSSFIILDSFPDYYSQENSLGMRLLTTGGAGHT